MRIRRAALAAIIGLALTGCSTPGTEQRVSASAPDQLWSQRIPYVGDNSRMAELVATAGFGPQGKYTISLQTNTSPFGATVEYQSLKKPFEDIDFTANATLVLGLVKNLDHVAVRSGTQSYSLTAADASNQLGYDVKTLGADKAKLAAYLKAQQD